MKDITLIYDPLRGKFTTQNSHQVATPNTRRIARAYFGQGNRTGQNVNVLVTGTTRIPTISENTNPNSK